MCPNELIATITAAAAVIADGRTPNEISLLASIFTQLGDSLATLSISKELLCQKPDCGKN